MTIAAAYARECLDYFPETGELVWKHRPREHFATSGAFAQINSRCAGKSAGCRDNRWCNLREATRTQNNANSKCRKTNKSGLKGVSASGKNKWAARIQLHGKQRKIGDFDCPAAAHFAYLIEADKAFGAYARPS